MNKSGPYRRLGAWALLLLFSTFGSVKALHALLDHHHESADHPVCHISKDAHSTHIHDERWATEDCAICAFVVATQDHFLGDYWPTFAPSLPLATSANFYQSARFCRELGGSGMRRGPPRTALNGARV